MIDWCSFQTPRARRSDSYPNTMSKYTWCNCVKEPKQLTSSSLSVPKYLLLMSPRLWRVVWGIPGPGEENSLGQEMLQLYLTFCCTHLHSRVKLNLKIVKFQHKNVLQKRTLPTFIWLIVLAGKWVKLKWMTIRVCWSWTFILLSVWIIFY